MFLRGVFGDVVFLVRVGPNLVLYLRDGHEEGAVPAGVTEDINVAIFAAMQMSHVFDDLMSFVGFVPDHPVHVINVGRQAERGREGQARLDVTYYHTVSV